MKELWEIDPAKHQAGLVVHTAGWPMDSDTYGGGFLYHLEGNQVTLGFVTGLDYSNPYLSPFEEMQRWKTHPAIRKYLEGGKRIGYGARAITAGGALSLPKTVFPGGALVGCEAGYLNASRIKGSHAAIKTGMLAAEAAYAAVTAGRQHDELSAYPAAYEASWLAAELNQARNFKAWFKKGVYMGSFMTGMEQWLLPRLGIKSPPWTIHRDKPDHAMLRPAAECQPIPYPKPDNKLTFDRLTSVFISNTNHEEHQPAHLTLKDASVPVSHQPGQIRRPREPLLPGGRVRVREERRQHRPAADQRAELRALQDVRHQGPDAKHRLGHARGRRRAELQRHVIEFLLQSDNRHPAADSAEVRQGGSNDILGSSRLHAMDFSH